MRLVRRVKTDGGAWLGGSWSGRRGRAVLVGVSSTGQLQVGNGRINDFITSGFAGGRDDVSCGHWISRFHALEVWNGIWCPCGRICLTSSIALRNLQIHDHADR